MVGGWSIGYASWSVAARALNNCGSKQFYIEKSYSKTSGLLSDSLQSDPDFYRIFTGPEPGLIGLPDLFKNQTDLTLKIRSRISPVVRLVRVRVRFEKIREENPTTIRWFYCSIFLNEIHLFESHCYFLKKSGGVPRPNFNMTVRHCSWLVWRDIGSHGKAPRFGPLTVESRRALKLLSDCALIVLSVRLY